MIAVLSEKEREENQEKKQAAFLHSYALTGNITKSMHFLDPDNLFSENPHSLYKIAHALITSNRNISLSLMAEEKGATVNAVMDVLLEGMKASETVVLKKKGRADTTFERINWTERRQSAMALAELLGMIQKAEGKQSEKKEAGDTYNQQNNFILQNKKLQKLLGNDKEK